MLDLIVTENKQLNQNYSLIKLTTTDSTVLPAMFPGQFVEVRVDGSSKTFLRRPISVNFVDRTTNELWLLIQIIGDGTQRICEAKVGDLLNLLLPLGNTFTMPQKEDRELLLVGGGVGTAPMLYLGACLKEQGYLPKFLLGARSKNDLLQLEEFARLGEVFCTTEDHSYGEKGYVTDHSVLKTTRFDRIYTCGPKPMMMAIAGYASKNKVVCEVSLENMMACGFGVCLCCVEKTSEGNVCVCKDGPVFNIEKLTWIN